MTSANQSLGVEQLSLRAMSIFYFGNIGVAFVSEPM